MPTSTVYRKSAQGRQEIASRSRRLPSPLRSLLFMVDGQRDVDELQHVADTLHAPHDAVAQLLAAGLIEPADAAPPAAAAESVDPVPTESARRFITLSGLMSEAIGEHLGLRGFLMQLRVERCTDVEELLAMLPDVVAAIGKAKGRDFAAGWETIARKAAT